MGGVCTGVASREVVRPEGFGATPADFFSPAIKAGGWVFVSQQLATEFRGGLALRARPDPESPYICDALELQARFIMEEIRAILRAAGCNIASDVVRVNQWFASDRPDAAGFETGDYWPHVDSVSSYVTARNAVMNAPSPTTTSVSVRELLIRGALVGVDVLAVDSRTTPPEPLSLPLDLPPLPFGGAIRAGEWLFVTGQTPSDFRGDWMRKRNMGAPSGVAPEARANPHLWLETEIELQTRDTLRRLEAIAEGLGTSLERCAKAVVYLGHPRDYVGFERIWKEWFPTRPPARVVVPFTGLAIRGIKIEIDALFLTGDSELAIEPVETSDAPEPLGHQPQANRVGPFVFFSSQLPIDSEGRVPGELRGESEMPYFSAPTRLQLRRLLENVSAIADAARTSLEHTCKVTSFHSGFQEFPHFIEEWRKFFPADPPALSSVRIGGGFLLVPYANLMLDVVGYVPAEAASRRATGAEAGGPSN